LLLGGIFRCRPAPVAAPLTRGLTGSDAFKGAAGALGLNSFGQSLVAGFVSGVITQRIRMAVYNKGKLDYASIGADAFGNALGDSIVAQAGAGGGDGARQDDRLQAMRNAYGQDGSGEVASTPGIANDWSSRSLSDQMLVAIAQSRDRAPLSPLADADGQPLMLAGGDFARSGNSMRRMDGRAIYKSVDDNGTTEYGDADPTPYMTRDPVAGSNHDEVVNRLRAGAAREGEVRLALQAKADAEQRARESRTGWGGALQGANDFGVNTARSPYYLYRSVTENGIASTIDQIVDGMMSLPETISLAAETGDMRTLTAEGMGAVFGLKGMRGAGLERSLGGFSKVELGALREAGLADMEIARQVELLGDVHLFRGTSEGFPGNPGLQRLGITPASTDPAVATIFALESRAKGGTPIVLFGERSAFEAGIDLGNGGDVRRVLEREVQVNMSIPEFANAAPYQVSADTARQALKDMGVVDLPPRISDSQRATDLLRSTPRMTPEQIREFLSRVR
jgi:hypothetical protein